MIRTLLPAVLGLVAILSLSFYEGYAMKDRWSEVGAEAKVLGERFEQVPLNIGDWTGEDLPVEELIRKTAGAVNYVSRRYTNTVTNDKVVLWLIVGHSRDIVRHTPNVCRIAQGFRQISSQLRHSISLADGQPATFYTAKYEKEDALSRCKERVFWTFNHPEDHEWVAPTDGARAHYGLAKALYKLYFTSVVQHDEDTVEDNVAADFAELMLPVIDEVLFPEEAASPAGAEAAVVN